MCTCKKIFVTNRRLSDLSLDEQVERVFEKSRPNTLILREKDLPESEYRDLSLQIKEICDSFDVEFIVNKFWQVAFDMSVPVQLSFQDYVNLKRPEYGHKTESLRDEELCVCSNIKFPYTWVSIHSVEEALAASSAGADCLIAGHIFTTACKPGIAPRGIQFLTDVISEVEVPVYAIGGIKSGNLQLVIAAGADGACQMSYYMKM